MGVHVSGEVIDRGVFIYVKLHNVVKVGYPNSMQKKNTCLITAYCTAAHHYPTIAVVSVYVRTTYRNRMPFAWVHTIRIPAGASFEKAFRLLILSLGGRRDLIVISPLRTCDPDDLRVRGGWIDNRKVNRGRTHGFVLIIYSLLSEVQPSHGYCPLNRVFNVDFPCTL